MVQPELLSPSVTLIHYSEIIIIIIGNLSFNFNIHSIYLQLFYRKRNEGTVKFSIILILDVINI